LLFINVVFTVKQLSAIVTCGPLFEGEDIDISEYAIGKKKIIKHKMIILGKKTW